MSRSIHRTRRDLREVAQSVYADKARKQAELDQLYEELARKRQVKAQVKGERRHAEEPLPPTEPESIPILIRDQSEHIHYPASVEDLRAVMRLLPAGVINGIHSITLSLGARHQSQDDEPWEPEPDPYTGRYGNQSLPGVFNGRLLGQYSSKSAKIRLFAYVYDPALPNREMWEFFLRLQMLSTFVHEVGHHHDFTERLARGRWLGDSDDKVEIYAERAEHEWTQQCVVPYLIKAYPAQLRALDGWLEHHGGIKLPLDKLAGDPRVRVKNGLVKIQAIWNIRGFVKDLATGVAEGNELIRTRTDFACSLHYNEDYGEALQILDRVLADCSDDLEALTLRADIFVHQERYEEAKSLTEKVIALDENYLDAWVMLAHALEGLQNWPRLLEVTTHILTLEGEDQYTRRSVLQQRVRTNLELAEFNAAQKDIDDLLLDAPPYLLRRIEQLKDRLSSKIGQAGQIEQAG